MSADEPTLWAIEARMIALVRCVLAKAASDDEFAGQLKQVLFTNEPPLVTHSELPASTQAKERNKTKRVVFDVVGFVARNGADRLPVVLAEMSADDLAEIVRKHRCMDIKSVKGAERAAPDRQHSGLRSA